MRVRRLGLVGVPRGGPASLREVRHEDPEEHQEPERGHEPTGSERNSPNRITLIGLQVGRLVTTRPPAGPSRFSLQSPPEGLRPYVSSTQSNSTYSRSCGTSWPSASIRAS